MRCAVAGGGWGEEGRAWAGWTAMQCKADSVMRMLLCSARVGGALALGVLGLLVVLLPPSCAAGPADNDYADAESVAVAVAVEEMERVGRDLLARTAPAGSELKFGYHVPPWRSVDHLQ